MLSHVIQPGTRFVLFSEGGKVTEIEFLRLEWGISEETGNYAFVLVCKENNEDKEVSTPLWMWQDLLPTHIFTKEMYDSHRAATLQIFANRNKRLLQNQNGIARRT